jgi:UDPglucose 6-dehydrogenase
MTGLSAGVVGAGYVGLTTAVCLAEREIDTVCVDVDPAKVDELNRAVVAIDEPGLSLLLRDGLAAGTLRFSLDCASLADRDVVFVCVGTPSGDDGSADLSAVESVVDELGTILRPGAVVALKSTVPVGTSRRMAHRLTGAGIRVVANPEFLREGHAVYDFRHPDRIVIGAENEEEADAVHRLYGSGKEPTMRMSPESAEVAKYASNAFLAVKLSYANSLAHLCARVGAEVADVTRCMGADVRIGQHFLQPGPGWGGSCLPKDTAALLHTGQVNGVDLPEVQAARATNAGQPSHIGATLSRLMPRAVSAARIAALGLTFKAGTSDVRDSPALTICGYLSRAGAQVTGYDPRLAFVDSGALRRAALVAVDDPYLATKAADAILVLTEWPEFRELNWAVIAEQAPAAVVLDTRNLLDPAAVGEAGLTYIGNGTASGY